MKNVNLTDVLIGSAPVKERLKFGLNTNIILKNVSNETRKDKNGNKVKKNCYMTFVKVDPDKDNKALASYTFSYFDIDDKYIVSSFLHQLNQLMAICVIISPEDAYEEMSEKIFDIITEEGLEDDLGGDDTKNSKGFKNAQKAMVDILIEDMQPYFNNTDSLLQLVVVTNRTGKYLDLPKEDSGFIGKMGDKKLSVGSKYKRIYLKSQEPEEDEPDTLNTEELSIDDALSIDDDLELSGDI